MNTNYISRIVSGAIFTGILFLALMGISASQLQAQNLPEANPSADIDQCANGKTGSAVPCNNANYQNGNLNPNNSHYQENDVVPFRIKFNNLVIGTSYSITLNFGSTKGGKHAYDYLSTYNRTETVGNNPCSGITNCGAPTIFPIPLDPNVPGSVQQAGNFTLFGGTITGTSGYTVTGSFAGDSETYITVTFTAGTTNPVLAFGGHIASRFNYPSGSASDIPGSPYHLAILDFSGGSGAQDRSLKIEPIVLSPTAATAMLAGRVMVDNGFTRGSGLLLVTVQNTRTLETQTVLTNRLGYYEVNDLLVGDTYVISVSGKGYSFTPQTFTLVDDSALDMFGSATGAANPKGVKTK